MVHQLSPMSDPVRRASMAHSTAARLTAMSARGQRASRKTTAGQKR